MIAQYRWLLVTIPIVILALTAFTSAFATPPEFVTIQVDESGNELGSCDGFDVTEDVFGTIKVSFHWDQDGNEKMEIDRFNLRHTFRNSVTGESLFTPDVGIEKFDFSEDNVSRIGIVSHLVVPEEGLVFAHLGYIVYDLTTGEVVFEAGRHDDFAGLLPALCSALE